MEQIEPQLNIYRYTNNCAMFYKELELIAVKLWIRSNLATIYDIRRWRTEKQYKYMLGI